jgi:hypothetical protein
MVPTADLDSHPASEDDTAVVPVCWKSSKDDMMTHLSSLRFIDFSIISVIIISTCKEILQYCRLSAILTLSLNDFV